MIFFSMTPIILLTILKEGSHELFEFPHPKHISYLYSHLVLNFNLTNIASGLGLGTSESDTLAPKEISEDKSLKVPMAIKNGDERKEKED